MGRLIYCLERRNGPVSLGTCGLSLTAQNSWVPLPLKSLAFLEVLIWESGDLPYFDLHLTYSYVLSTFSLKMVSYGSEMPLHFCSPGVCIYWILGSWVYNTTCAFRQCWGWTQRFVNARQALDPLKLHPQSAEKGSEQAYGFLPIKQLTGTHISQSHTLSEHPTTTIIKILSALTECSEDCALRRSHYLAQVGLSFITLLPQPPKCWL